MRRVASGGVFWGVCKLSKTLVSLSADGWGFVPVLLVVWSEASSTGACRQLGGAGSWCQHGEFWVNPRQLIFPGARDSLVVQHPGRGAPILEAPARPLAGEPRPHNPHSMGKKWGELNKQTKKTQDKEQRQKQTNSNNTIKKRKRKQADKQNPRQIVKTKPKNQNQNKETHTEKEKKQKQRRQKPTEPKQHKNRKTKTNNKNKTNKNKKPKPKQEAILKKQKLPWWHSGLESACQYRGHGFEPWSGKITHATEQLGPLHHNY